LFETAIGWMAPHVGGYLSGGAMRRPLGSGVAEIVPHQAFPTADGHIMVAAGNDNLFRALCGAIGMTFARDERFATNSKRVENRAEITALLADIFARRSTSEWCDALEAAGVPNGPINNLKQVFEEPQVVARGMKIEVDEAARAS
jgi:crotonobetainyl-CoA:carnitine CoA-transferase CaiB-like acyl-CoA transferase